MASTACSLRKCMSTRCIRGATEKGAGLQVEGGGGLKQLRGRDHTAQGCRARQAAGRAAGHRRAPPGWTRLLWTSLDRSGLRLQRSRAVQHAISLARAVAGWISFTATAPGRRDAVSPRRPWTGAWRLGALHTAPRSARLWLALPGFAPRGPAGWAATPRHAAPVWRQIHFRRQDFPRPTLPARGPRPRGFVTRLACCRGQGRNATKQSRGKRRREIKLAR